MSKATEIVRSDQPPVKRRRTDNIEYGDTAMQPGAVVNVPKYGGHTYTQTALNDQSSAIFGDVHFNFVQDQHSNQKYDALLRSLVFAGMDARFRNIETELENTCQWIVQHEQFVAWKDKENTPYHHGFLWIKGKPGCGKSTIMRFIYRWAKQVWSEQVNLCYFFSGRAPTQLEKSSLGLYRSLTYQVLQAIPDARPAFIDKFTVKEKLGSVEEWTTTELKGFLQDVFTETLTRKINVFIDALDEGSENDVRDLVSHLEKAGRIATSNRSDLRICLSSRHYPHISVTRGLSLNLDKQQDHDKDIKLYIQVSLPSDGEDSEMRLLQQEILEKSNSVFLWIIIVMPMLKRVYDEGGSLNIEATRGLLARLPEELEDLFAQILAKNRDSLAQCALLSQWVLFATRALSPMELYLAIQYSCFNMDAIDDIPPPDRISKCLLNWSRGLIEVTKSEPPVIQFIHETVRTFLLSSKGLPRLNSALNHNVIGSSHEDLRDACSRYIRSTQPPTGNCGWQEYNKLASELKTKQPLLEYATNGLLQHADLAQRYGVSQASFLEQLHSKSRDVWWKWVRLHNYFDSSCDEITLQVSFLYAACKLHLVNLAQCLATSPEIINVQGEKHGCPLAVACWYEHEDLVELLLKRGADTNLLAPYLLESKKVERGGFRNFRILKLLYQFNSRLPTNILLNGLNCAIYESNAEGVQLLLELAIHLSIDDHDLVSLLRLACRYNRVEIVQLLIKRQIDVNFQQNFCDTPLYAAAGAGHPRIVRMLLGAGANVNALGGPHGSALMVAAHCGHDEIMRILLGAGADANAQNGHLGSPLTHVACNGSPHLVALLLAGGANVNARVGYFGGALATAVYHDVEEIVQTLLQAGADTMSQGWKKARPETVPLFIASRKPCRRDMLKLLLDAEIHLDTKQDFLERAIYWATVGIPTSRGPHREVIAILEQYLRTIGGWVSPRQQHIP